MIGLHNIHRQCQSSSTMSTDSVRDPQSLVGLHNVHRLCQRSSTMSTDSVRDPRGLVRLHNVHRQCQRSSRSDRLPHDSCQNNEWESVQMCNRSLPDNERVLPVHHVKGTTPDLIWTSMAYADLFPFSTTTHRHPAHQNCSDVSFFLPSYRQKSIWCARSGQIQKVSMC